MKYFLDTNICIFHINDSAPKMSDKIESMLFENIKIPSMVAAELYYGAEKSQKRDENFKRYKDFISLFEVVFFDSVAAEHYASIRADLEKKGMPVGANDMVIAAIARAHGGVLVTNNTREFSRINALAIEDWV
ncbi:MAG: type II toxin-antitoxin system VapC family toxin [Defluviitaleaceae bacterium]|nr:type II toxin-antitoxin system VapC family toxin [Defluviitaleaceae bacterium]